jgi:hypothetical protein
MVSKSGMLNLARSLPLNVPNAADTIVIGSPLPRHKVRMELFSWLEFLAMNIPDLIAVTTPTITQSQIVSTVTSSGLSGRWGLSSEHIIIQ